MSDVIDARGPQPRKDVNLNRRRNWRHLWVTDLQAHTAVHECGLVVKLSNIDPVAGTAALDLPNERETLDVLAGQHGRAAAVQMLRRLREEAVSVYLKRKAIAEWPGRAGADGT